MLCFAWESWIYFESNFAYDTMCGSRFLFSHMDDQLFQHHLLKKVSFVHWIPFAAVLKVNWPHMWDLFLDSPLFHWSRLSSVPQCLDYCSFIVSIEIRKWESSKVVLSPNGFAYSRSVASPSKFTNQLVDLYQKCTNSYILLDKSTFWKGRIYRLLWEESIILTILSLLNPMNRGAWQATAPGSQRVRHDWATKQACTDSWTQYISPLV